MRRLACALAIAAAGVACGTNDDQRLEGARRGLCSRAVGTTVSDLSKAWGYGPDLPVQCGTDVRLRGTGTCDPAAPRCLVTWKEVFRTNGTDCNPVGGCAYMCEAFTPLPAGDVAGETICATVFSTGQIPILGLGGP